MRKLGALRQTALLLIVGLSLVLQPALTPDVLAHANVIRSEPAANSVLDQPPTAVTIWFTEPLEPQLSQIQVLNSQGRRVDNGDAAVAAVDPTMLAVSLPPLPNGTYVVAWANVSTVDGHKVRGSFVFSVGEPLNASALSLPPEQPLVQSPLEPVLRWLSLLAILAGVGGLAFELLILRPVLRRVNADDARRRLAQLLAGRLLKGIWLALALFLVASLGQLLLQTMITSELPLRQLAGREFLAVLFETGWGRLWLWRMALLLIMPGVLDLAFISPAAPGFPQRRQPQFNRLAQFVAVLAGVGILLTLSLGSHAAAAGEIRLAAIFNDFLHLLAAAFWAGSLFHFALSGPVIFQNLPKSQRREVLAELVARFSGLAGLSVLVLVVTGLFSAYAQVTVLPALTATPYGLTLLAKMGLVLPLLALGALNLVWVRPRLASQERAGVWLRRFVTAEAVLVTLVLLPVGLLTALEPARQVASREGLGRPAGLTFHEAVEGTDISLLVEPGQTGPNRLLVTLKDHRGRPLTTATDVTVRATYLEADLGENPGSAVGDGNGQYLVENQLLNIAGPWQVELVVRRPDALDARTAFRFEVTPAVAVSSAAIAPTASAGQLFGAAELALLGAACLWLARNRRSKKGAAAGLAGVAATAGALWLALNPLLTAPGNPGAPAVVSPVGQTEAAAPQPAADPLRNPYPPDAVSLATGQTVFDQNCTPCHGLTGRGDGPLAATLSPPPADLLTHISLHPDIELFRLVRDGKTFTAMPSFGGKLTAEQIWHLVNYLRAFEVDLRLAETQYRQGQALLEQNKSEAAVVSFSAAIKLVPKHIWAYLDRGIAHRQLGQYEPAIADHSRAIELKPDFAEAYFNRGVDYNETHRPEQAVADYNRAIELDPGMTIAYYARGLAYADLGNLAQAIRDFNQSLEMFPDFKRVYLDRGLAYMDSGDPEKAYNDLKKYLELVPEAENRETVAGLMAQLAGLLAAQPAQSLPTTARTPAEGGN